MYNEPLPIGSVVQLIGGEKKLMIIGYLKYPKENQTDIYDYAGCLFPEGFQSPAETYIFNHENIKNVFALGYQNQQQIEFRQRLIELFQEKKGTDRFN